MSVFGLKFHFKWDGVSFTEETAYVLDHYVRVGFPITPGNFLFEPVANIGICRLVLDNSTGRFTPGNSSGALFGDLLPGVEMKIVSISPEIFQGIIESIDINNEEFLKRFKIPVCVITCVDELGKLRQIKADVDLATDKAVNVAVQELVELAPTANTGSYNTTLSDTIPVWGSRFDPESTEVLQALKMTLQTFFGWLYVAQGDGVVFKDREAFQIVPHPTNIENIWNDGDIFSIGARHIRTAITSEHIRNQIKLWYYPEEEQGSTVVLWEANSWLGLGPGKTRTYFLHYRDPDTGDKVASLDVEDFTATTDYVINSKHDGTGTNLTSDPDIDISFEIRIHLMKVTVTNNKAINIFFTKFQCRGKPILVYNPVLFQYDDSSSQNAYGLRSEVIEAITGPFNSGNYLDNEYKGVSDLGKLWLTLLKDPYYYVAELSLWYTHKYTEDVFDIVEITDTKLGIDDLHRILAIEYGKDRHPLDGVDREYTTFYLMPGVFAPIMIASHSIYGKANQNRAGW